MSVLIAATPWGLVTHWSRSSQEQARRNAMTACTALAARRLERLEVEQYIADTLAGRGLVQPVLRFGGPETVREVG